MGCKMSKPAGEPPTITIRLPGGCSKISGRYSSPSRLADGEHVFKNPNIDSYHSVSLTSSTYGSLRLDSLRDYGEELSRIVSSDYLGGVTSENIRDSVNLPIVKDLYSWSRETDPSLSTSGRNRNNENVESLKGSNNKQVEIINMWELMEGIEDEKAALKMLRGLVERPRVSGYDSGKSSPHTIHTIEDVDNVLDARRSLPIDYHFRRGSSLDSVVPVRQSHESGLNSDKKIGKTTAMLQKRRARAIQISQEVIEELDDLRRKNLARSQEFNTSGRKIISRSQEFSNSGRRDVSRSQEFNTTGRRDISRSLDLHSTGRRDMSRRQEFDAAERHNFSQSQDFDSIGRHMLIQSPDLDPVKRGNLYRNQEQDSRKSGNAVRSQEFGRPPVAKPKEVAAIRHSFHEIPRTVQLKDARVTAMSKPDIVLRSPMLRGVRGHERQRARPGQDSSMSSAAINIESTNKPMLRSQAQPTAEPKTTLPEAAGPTMVNLDLNSSQVM